VAVLVRGDVLHTLEDGSVRFDQDDVAARPHQFGDQHHRAVIALERKLQDALGLWLLNGVQVGATRMFS